VIVPSMEKGRKEKEEVGVPSGSYLIQKRGAVKSLTKDKTARKRMKRFF